LRQACRCARIEHGRLALLQVLCEHGAIVLQKIVVRRTIEELAC
jgi:hypothetical protein